MFQIDKDKVTLACLFSFLVMLVPSLFRLAPFVTEHFSILVWEQLPQKGLLTLNVLASGTTYVLTTPSHLLWHVLPYFWVPWILGMISVLLLGLLLKPLGKWASIGLLFFVVSPQFILLFSWMHPLSLFLPLLLLTGVLILYDKPWPAALVFLLLPFFGLIPFVGATLVLITLCIMLKKRWIVHALPGILVAALLFSHLSLQGYPLLAQQHLSLSFLSDIHGVMGVSLFVLALALIGFIINWKHYKLALFFLGVHALLTLYFSDLFTALLPSILMLSVLALDYLFKRSWELPVLKKIILYVFFLGVLFSFLSFQTGILATAPTNSYVSDVHTIGSLEGVFTHPERGLWLQALTNSSVLMDSATHARYPQMHAHLFHSYDLMLVQEHFDTLGVHTIFIDEAMKNGLVWEKEQQGLLFLLTDQRYFALTHNTSSYDLWSYS